LAWVPARTLLEKRIFSVLAGTTSEGWLAGRLKEFQLDATVAPVANYEAGIQRVLNRGSDVFFADRPILLDTARRNASEDLIVLDRLFTYEPIALGFKRGDEDFRLVVDRALSRLFRSEGFRYLYGKWFGMPDESATTFFRLNCASRLSCCIRTRLDRPAPKTGRSGQLPASIRLHADRQDEAT